MVFPFSWPQIQDFSLGFQGIICHFEDINHLPVCFFFSFYTLRHICTAHCAEFVLGWSNSCAHVWEIHHPNPANQGDQRLKPPKKNQKKMKYRGWRAAATLQHQRGLLCKVSVPSCSIMLYLHAHHGKNAPGGPKSIFFFFILLADQFHFNHLFILIWKSNSLNSTFLYHQTSNHIIGIKNDSSESTTITV